jgi:hypothetical protein
MAAIPSLTSINSVQVNLEQAYKIRKLLTSDATQSRCKDILIRSLFMFGIRGRSALADKNVTEDFVTFINDDINPLAIHAAIDAAVQGFTLYNFVEREVDTPVGPRKLISPNYVPPIALTITKVLKNDYTVDVKIRRTNRVGVTTLDSDTNDGIFYYEWVEHEPDIRDGSIGSRLAPFLDINESFLLKQKCLDSAILQSSHPPVLYQESPNKTDLNEANMTIAFAESYLGEMALEREKNETYKQQVIAHENKFLNHVWIPANSILNQQIPLSENNRLRFYPTPIDNLHTVPKGFVVAPQIAPAIPQQNFLEYEASKDRKIALAWGIPPSIALADSQKSSASGNTIGDNDLEYFAKNIQYYQKQIIDYITEVYKTFLILYGNGQPDVVFELPIIPWISARALYEAYNQNIINFETLQTHTLRINGLSETDRALVPNVFVRPPPNGSENTVTGMIEARIANINAESFERKQKALLVKDERINGPAESGEDPEMQEIELKIKDKELEMAELKLQHMDKQIALQKVKNQAPKPTPAAKG